MTIGVVDVALLTPPLGGGHFARALSHSDQPRQLCCSWSFEMGKG